MHKQGLSLETLDDRVVVLEGRIGSYSDSELVYRQAVAEWNRRMAESASQFVAEREATMNAAKLVMEKSVAAAVAQFAEPLRDVAKIRSAQKNRHDRETIMAEQQVDRDVQWRRNKVQLGCAALFVNTVLVVYHLFSRGFF